MKDEIRHWRTGMADLDRLLFDGRGFRSGRAYISSGPHQAGKTILAMCFLRSMIAQGGAFTYITIGRPAKDVVADRRGLPGNAVSDIYFAARQRFSIEEPGTAFHLFAPLEERVKREYAQLLDDLHLNEDGTIGLSVERDETGAITERTLAVRSLFGGAVPRQRLAFRVASDTLIEIAESLDGVTATERLRLAREEKLFLRREDSRMPAGMRFLGNVTIHGNIINIEGNQYNLQQDSKDRVLTAINEVLLKGIRANGDILPTLRALAVEIDRRNDIETTEIAESVHHGLEPELRTPGTKENIESIYSKLAIGASGSLLATGIIQGTKLLLGIP